MSSSTRIDKRIVKYRVLKPEDKEPAKAVAPVEELAHSRDGTTAKVIRMHEEIQRPEMLIGSTYKIKTPVSDHAMYVTINDIVLNEGTEYEHRRPFEVFINSKNLDHFQWIVALTRIISAVFRKGGDVAFLVDADLVIDGIEAPTDRCHGPLGHDRDIEVRLARNTWS